MMKLNRYAVVAALAIFLSGCVAQREPAPVDEVKPVPEQPAQPQQPVPVVPTVPTIPQQPGPIEHEDQTAQPAPRVRHYDWNGAMQPMVGKMLQADGVKAGGVLLVDSVNNRTNGSLNAGEATETLRNAQSAMRWCKERSGAHDLARFVAITGQPGRAMAMGCPSFCQRELAFFMNRSRLRRLETSVSGSINARFSRWQMSSSKSTFTRRKAD